MSGSWLCFSSCRCSWKPASLFRLEQWLNAGIGVISVSTLHSLRSSIAVSPRGFWGGWLAQGGVDWHLGSGTVDFAGSGVVHCIGGVMALAGCIVIGPRIGKYVNGRPVPMVAHSAPAIMGATLLLSFGWLGFNPGSTLSGTDLRISFIVVNTVVASVVASTVSMIEFRRKAGKWDPAMMCNGFLAGLVALTAPCAFVTPIGAALISVVAGVLVIYSSMFFENIGVDDVAGAISVHGSCGAWGVISVGLFACGEYGAGFNGSNAGNRPLLRWRSRSANNAVDRRGGLGDMGFRCEVCLDEI